MTTTTANIRAAMASIRQLFEQTRRTNLDSTTLQSFGGAGLFSLETADESVAEANAPESIFELAGEVCPSVLSVLAVQGMVLRCLKWTSAGIRDQYVDALVMGRNCGAFCLTDATGGCDPTQMTTHATAESGGWTITGTKRWISQANIADVLLVFAKTGPTGIGAFVVDADTPGVRVVPEPVVCSFPSAPLSRVELKDCRVGSDRMIGSPNIGFTMVAQHALHHGRIVIAWGSVGIIRAAIGLVERRIAERPRAAHALLPILGRMRARYFAARSACEQASRNLRQATPTLNASVMAAKYSASRAAFQAADDCVQVYGAAGLVTESDVHRLWLDSRALRIIEGTDEILETAMGHLAWAE